jgi:hypothetical protein
MPADPILILDSREQWRPVPVEDSLAVHGYTFAGGTWLRDGVPVDGELDLPADMAPLELPGVTYRRTQAGGGLDWTQYWTWWPYNPKTYAGRGEHEGDWEMVQIGCVADRPVLMTCSQHDGGEKREYWRVTLDPGTKRPLVYVARDSHANYFAPSRDVTDIADGKGERLELAVREFEDWKDWPGHWGNSRNSPGPLSTRRAWKAPHAWHGQARG